MGFFLWSPKLSFMEMYGTFHVANADSVSARHISVTEDRLEILPAGLNRVS